MQVLPGLMLIAFLIPAVFGIALLAVVALTMVYAPRAHEIDNVILLARKLDPSDLEVLFDAGAEWQLRQSLGTADFRIALEDRIRLAQEYLRRLGHNTTLIQFWVLREKQKIESKAGSEQTERKLLVAQALQLAVELRLYSLAAGARIWLWRASQAHRWPAGWAPHMAALRVQCGVNVVEKYRKLTDLAIALSAPYSEAYRDRLLQAL